MLARMSRDHVAPRHLVRLTFAAVAFFAVLGAGWSPAAPAEQPPGAADATVLLDRLEPVWASRDLAAWTALWEFETPEQREYETEQARTFFDEEETVLSFLLRPKAAPGARRLTADVQVFAVHEPRARVEYWRLRLELRSGRWVLVAREGTSEVSGLVHLSLDPRGYRAGGHILRFEDLELVMEAGTVFTTPEALGPTALVFVGRGRVRFSPRPTAERDQLRQFSGAPELDVAVHWAFVRIHPAYLPSALAPPQLEPDPDAARRWPEAERIWAARAQRTFVLDAALPRSPWWLLPSPGDAIVDFPWKKRRTLTYALSKAEAEDINVFDRDRRLQICSYPSGGRSTRYTEEAGRSVDVLHHGLVVRFEPERQRLSAVHTMRLHLLLPVPTLRLKLHDDFVVHSITSPEGGALPFFRVREQGSLVVSLGPLAGRERAFAITVRYSGRHNPAPIDQEVLQTGASNLRFADVAYIDQSPIVYSNRTAWYSHPGIEDYATVHAVFDTPRGYLAVTGGELVSIREEEGRARAEFKLQQPGKFISAALGRFEDMGMRQQGEQVVRGFAMPRMRGETQQRLDTAEAILAFYAERFGPNAYPFMSLAIGEAITPGGHSPPGMVLLQQRSILVRGGSLSDDPANFADLPDFFLAHELAHQWWGQGTAPANYRERWISEAWAQYASALWTRHRQGEDAFHGMLDRMGRWALRHTGDGPIHLGQRLGVVRDDPKIFRAVVYNKGAWVLQMLRELLGDAVFYAGARAFLESHRFALAGTEDLREAFETASGRDLAPYFEQWIYGVEVPELVWTWRSEARPGGWRTAIEVRPTGLPGPLPLDITILTDRGRENRRVTLDPPGGSWSIETAERPRGVELNEGRTILARVRRVGRLPHAQR